MLQRVNSPFHERTYKWHPLDPAPLIALESFCEFSDTALFNSAFSSSSLSCGSRSRTSWGWAVALPSIPRASNSINTNLPLSAETGLREEAQLHSPLPSTSSTVSGDPSGSESATTDDDEGFIAVRRRRPKRHRNSSDSDSTVITSKPLSVPPFIVIILPEPSVSVSTYNTVKLSRCLDSLVRGQITEIRLNGRKNVIGHGVCCCP